MLAFWLIFGYWVLSIFHTRELGLGGYWEPVIMGSVALDRLIVHDEK